MVRSVLAARLAAALVSATLPATLARPAAAQGVPAWAVKEKLLGEPKRPGTVTSPDDAKKAEDVSGLACAEMDFPKICLVVDDESQGAQVVIVRDGELVAGDFIPLIEAVFQGKPLELDAEGVAYADGAFYVVGSHGRPRHAQGGQEQEARNQARAEATRQIFRIRFGAGAVDRETGRIKIAPEITASRALGPIIQAEPRLAASYDQALADNGVTIEGLAARGGSLFVGFRGPVLDDGMAVILEVPSSAIFDSRPGATRLHKLDLGPDTQGQRRGVRDLVPHMGGFLVLAGPVHDPADKNYVIRRGDYSVLFWPGNGAQLDGRYDLDGFGAEIKPEALLPLGQGRSFRALILFDGPEEGMPTPVRIELR